VRALLVHLLPVELLPWSGCCRHLLLESDQEVNDDVKLHVELRKQLLLVTNSALHDVFLQLFHALDHAKESDIWKRLKNLLPWVSQFEYLVLLLGDGVVLKVNE
jgi:hypothetical protein